uniref:Anthranilate synthase component 2 n=1 Tax=Polysiphonia sertularioides TaxID=945028 RepID=A0A1Z1MGF8_9FLOR|nr:Anthranilate synthase component II [Polysiphonia sertularioides]
MIIIIDNYDSFTHNLVQYTGELGYMAIVKRNDNLSLEEIEIIQPTHIIISPGPGKPEKSGICIEIIKKYSYKIPILGICLGHQAIGYTYGARISKLNRPSHGKIDRVIHNKKDIFKNVDQAFKATRYHSLIVELEKQIKDLEVTAWTINGKIMAIQHKKYKKLRGIQFHPESLWTQEGKLIIKNFLSS